MDTDEIEEKIEDCLYILDDFDSPFDEWERELIESLHEQYMERADLTERQQVALQKLWEKTCE